jgi:hypothetical protein
MIYLRVLNPPNTSLVALPCFFGMMDCAELQALVRPFDPLRVPSLAQIHRFLEVRAQSM